MVFSGYSGFLHQSNWPPRYNWNIVESGVKHLNPNPISGLPDLIGEKIGTDSYKERTNETYINGKL
jgi:hypothetical protein